MTHIQMAGIDHALAPVEIRERFAFTNADAREAMVSWADQKPVTGCLLLTTCNRTELWASATAPVDLLSLLCRWKGMDPEPVRPLFRTLEDEEAVTYLFHLAGGLRSRILGEDQILGQVKEALARAREAGVCGSTLEVLFRSAITGAKQVKTRLCLRTANASAAELAIGNLAGRLPMEGLPCLVIGNGEMGRLAATALHAAGCQVTVTLRTYRHGQTIVPAGCATHPYEDRCAILEGAHLVVSATTSPHYTLTRAQVDALDRPPVLFIDLAMPRDLDEAIAGREGVVMWNLDDLGDLPGQDDGARQAAQSILDEAMEDFTAWYDYRQSLPLIAALKDTALMRLRYDHAYAGLCEDNDLDGLAALAVQKTVDLMLGGMKGIVSPERLTACLEHMKKGSGK